MSKKPIAALLMAVAALGAASAYGLGLGEISLQSALNEPLKAQIKLRGTEDLGPEQIIVRLAPSADFERSGVERLYALTEMQFEVKISRAGDGVVYLRTEQPVREPYLDFLLEVRWPNGRVLREYTVLLDLPTYSAAPPPAVQAPSPRAPARPSVTPRSDGGGAWSGGPSYGVQAGDTLWSIARRTRPSDVSVQQMLDALHRENPEAFVDGDINRLRAGAVLRVPEELSAGAGEPVAGQPRPESPAIEPTTPGTEPTTGASSAGDAYLRIAGDNATDQGAAAGGEAGGAGAASEDTLATVQESLSAKERENAELASRVKALEEQVQNYQRVVDLKSEGLASAQSTSETASAPKPAPASPAPKPAPAPVTEPGFLQSLMDSGLAIVAAVIAAVLGVVALLVVRRRRVVGSYAPLPEANQKFRSSAKQTESPVPPVGEPAVARSPAPAPALRTEAPAPTPETPPVVALAPVAAAATPKTFDLSKVAPSSPPEETSDPLAEADMLVAYGRQGRAMEVLRRALAADPEQSQVRLKLMEILVAQDQQDEFLAEYDRVLALGSDDDVAAVRTMCIGSGRGQWLAEFDTSDGIQTVASLASPAPSPSRSLTASEDEEEIQELSSLDLEMQAPPLEASAGDDIGPGLDLDVALSEPADDGPGHDALPGFEDTHLGEFELDTFSLDRAEDSPLQDELPIELDLDLSSSVTADAIAPSDGTDTLDFDVGEVLDAEAAPPVAAEVAAFEPGADDAAEAAADADLLADTDEVETRLELARAFIDMGDPDGARDILEEVLAEGSDSQREAAEALLAGLETG